MIGRERNLAALSPSFFLFQQNRELVEIVSFGILSEPVVVIISVMDTKC